MQYFLSVYVNRQIFTLAKVNCGSKYIMCRLYVCMDEAALHFCVIGRKTIEIFTI